MTSVIIEFHEPSKIGMRATSERWSTGSRQTNHRLGVTPSAAHRQAPSHALCTSIIIAGLMYTTS